ncbi:MAG: hypothetical protein KOO66_13175, partial [Bacteroidales bacterium]|nr:hypothetical protein [Bacteroidales bacterium]
MSRKKYIALLYFMIIPFVLISQNINISALYSFSELKKGNYQSALDTLDKIISENPKADYYLARAEAFLKTKEYNKALINCD